eukprot:Skav215599  [mRNA]  locus=scaffold666:343489:349968:+ [translate_table: standard]
METSETRVGYKTIAAVARLFSGEVELRDAEFEVEPLKKLLVGTLPYTLEATASRVEAMESIVLAISCDRLQVFVPWSSLRKRSVQVKLGHVRIQAGPLGGERRARVRRGSWTSLKRRLELQKLRLAAAHLTDKAMKDGRRCWVEPGGAGAGLDLVEGRDIGRRQDHHNPSARMAMFPRQIRMSLNLPEVCTSLHSSEILGLIELVGDANQPTCPPAELLREEMQEEVKAAVAEFLAKRSKSRAFSIFRGSGTKKSKAGAVADAATAAAADTARRTAVAGAQAAQKAAHALGDARRSGQAAAEKALGSLMRAGGLKRSPKKTTSELAASREAATASREEEELQAVLALSLKEFEDQQAAKDAKTCEDESSDVKQQESLCQDQSWESDRHVNQAM